MTLDVFQSRGNVPCCMDILNSLVSGLDRLAMHHLEEGALVYHQSHRTWRDRSIRTLSVSLSLMGDNSKFVLTDLRVALKLCKLVASIVLCEHRCKIFIEGCALVSCSLVCFSLVMESWYLVRASWNI